MIARPVVREFFERYEESRNTFESGLIDSQYPDSFMFAGPAGARVIQKATVREVLLKGRELFRTLGHRRTTLATLEETALDDRYAMVRAQFVWRFEKAPAAPIDVDIQTTFILYLKDGVPQIVFQHEHEDFQQALRARGVLAA